MSKVSLVALVGADRNIGPKNGLPVFADRAEQRDFLNWVSILTEGQITIIGSNTFRIMQRLGLQPESAYHTIVVWTREGGVSPEELLAGIRSQTDQHIYICGGATTFRVFAPFCDNFYLRRAALQNPPDHRLDPILPGWQNSVQGALDAPRRFVQ